MKKLIFAVVAIMFLGGLLTASAEASRRVIKFKNNENQAANDLHIRFKSGCTVDWENTSPFDSERGVDGGGVHNLYGGTVAVGDMATVTVTSTGQTIIISKWWWTVGGDANGNGTRLGDVKLDNGGRILSCTGGTAAGDGFISVQIGGIQDTFQTATGHTPSQTLTAFMEFLDDFVSGIDTLIHYGQTSDSTVIFVGNIQGDPSVEMDPAILSGDSGQDLELIPIPLDTIPTLHEWGLIILALLLLSAGTIAVVRRRKAAEAREM